MTREEAKITLETLLSSAEDEDGPELIWTDKEAIGVAIEALKQPEIIRCENCHYYDGEHCDMYNAGTYPTDYCSYAGWKYEEDES